jgi:hypothetical protein
MDKEDVLKSVVIEDSEVAYWKKAFNESNVMLEKLESSLKYEKAVNEMCAAKLAIAQNNADL